MDYNEKYHNLYQLFGGYLNQSWLDIYIWEGREPTYQPIVRKYKTEFPKEDIEKTIAELKEVIALDNNFDEEDWREVLSWGLSLGLRPRGFGLSPREWLEDVLNILEEPMEISKKGFIPEGI